MNEVPGPRSPGTDSRAAGRRGNATHFSGTSAGLKRSPIQALLKGRIEREGHQ